MFSRFFGPTFWFFVKKNPQRSHDLKLSHLPAVPLKKAHNLSTEFQKDFALNKHL